MILISFALADESRTFAGRLAERRVSRGALPVISGLVDGGRPVALVHTGVGDGAACRERLNAVLRGPERPRYLISAGYAGGLAAELRVGDLIIGDNFSDAKLARSARRALQTEPAGIGELQSKSRSSTAGALALHSGALTTQAIMAETPLGKAALAASTGAIAVDMETAWIAEACAAAGVPMLSLRAISDAADHALPAPGGILFDQKRQRPRYVALPAWLLAHPASIGPFVKFVRGVGLARDRLAWALERVIAVGE